MDSLLSLPAESGKKSPYAASIHEAQSATKKVDLDLVKSASNALSEDRVEVAFNDLYKALSVTANEVLTKLNEILKKDLPDGVQSLKPEEYTPEKTASRIVDQVTGLFSVYAKQNPDLDNEALLSGFMDEVRSGVEQGYGDAFKILEDIGAFSLDSVKEGVEETKRLIDKKLGEFEQKMRSELGIEQPPKDAIAEGTIDELLKQGGVASISITA